MNEQQEARLHEIMNIARKLSWLFPNPRGYGYPIMEGSEVEKCILMAMDDVELMRFMEASEDGEVVKINKEEVTKWWPVSWVWKSSMNLPLQKRKHE